jgi:serine/threonine protein kinase
MGRPAIEMHNRVRKPIDVEVASGPRPAVGFTSPAWRLPGTRPSDLAFNVNPERVRRPARDLFRLVSTVVAEKYAVQAVVGESGYAVLYRADHIASKKTVALRVFKVLGEYDSDARQRLLYAFMQQEAALRSLAPRGSVIRAPCDIGPLPTRDGRWVPFMAFDWLEGASLDAILQGERGAGVEPRTLGDALSFLEPIAVALDTLHSQELAHLDLKPSKVFVVDDAPEGSPDLQLLDFGTANIMSHTFDAPPGSGSRSIAPSYFAPEYAAPEQLVSSGPARGPWTDVFALALIIGEMVTGRVPGEGADAGTLATTPRPTPRALGANVDDAVEEVFARALALDPRDRYPSAGAFWSAIRATLQEPRPPRSNIRSIPRNVPAPRVAIPPLPPMRGRLETLPDAASAKLEAAERAHRNPRLVILGVTLLLVGIAVGLLCTRPGAHEPSRDSHDQVQPTQGNR